MNKTQRSVVIFSLAGALTFFCFGCESFTGGGWIPSAAGGKAKATFGLALTCTDDGQGGLVFSGTVQYNDHGFLVTGANGKQMPLSLNATVPPTPESGITCEQFDLIEQNALGFNNVYVLPYLPQPTTAGAGGQIAIQVQDNGQTGPNHADVLTIAVEGGLYSGYFNTGNLQGGNISISIP